MIKYRYSARDKNGKEVKGVIEARSRDSVLKSLKAQDLLVVTISQDMGVDWKSIQEINIGGIPIKEKVVFMRQLATMTGAGLPLTQALEILEEQAVNPLFKKTISKVLGDVQAGESLAKAFRKHSGVFDEITLNLIDAGEQSGNLETILDRLAVEVEEQKKLKEKITSALIYPVIILLVILLVILLMMFVLIPAMAEIYGEFGAELPFVTRLLIDMSNFLVSYWWILIIVIAVIIISYKYYYDSPNGKKFIHKIHIKIPIFGVIVSKMQVAQFTRVLSLLLKSGLSIVRSLELTAGSLTNIIFREAILLAKEEVEKGTSIAIPIARSKVFPLLVSQMIAVGEESGELDNVLEKMSQYYNEEVNVATSNLTTLMEPIMLVLMGGVIAFIALAVYMPMFNLSGVIG